MEIDSILKKYKELGYDKKSLDRIEKAYLYAAEKHKGKIRKSGEDFIEHPLNVALILADLNVDDTTIVAALVHETISESDATLEELEKLFGKDVRIIFN